MIAPLKYTYTVKTGYSCLRCGTFVSLSDLIAHDCPQKYEPTTITLPSLNRTNSATTEDYVRRIANFTRRLNPYDGLYIEDD